MEARYVKQEMAKNVPNGLRPSAVIASAPANVRLEQPLKQSRKEGLLARALASINGSVHYVEDVESKAYAP